MIKKSIALRTTAASFLTGLSLLTAPGLWADPYLGLGIGWGGTTFKHTAYLDDTTAANDDYVAANKKTVSPNAVDWFVALGYASKSKMLVAGELRVGGTPFSTSATCDRAKSTNNTTFTSKVEGGLYVSGMLKVGGHLKHVDIYGIGGIGGYSLKHTYSATHDTLQLADSVQEKWIWGPSLGAGAQWKLGASKDMLVGAEYTYTWLGSQHYEGLAQWADNTKNPPVRANCLFVGDFKDIGQHRVSAFFGYHF